MTSGTCWTDWLLERSSERRWVVYDEGRKRDDEYQCAIEVGDLEEIQSEALEYTLKTAKSR